MRSIPMSPGMKEMHDNMNSILGIEPRKPSFMTALFPIASNSEKEPCDECHLQPGQTCDVCHARQVGLSE